MGASTNLYAAKCYWPGVTERQIQQAACAAAAAGTASAMDYLGAILFADDELVRCLFNAPTHAAVRRTAERAGIPCERVMNSRWLPHPPRAIKACAGGQQPPTTCAPTDQVPYRALATRPQR